MNDYRDVVLAHLAADEVSRIDQIAHLLTDLDAERLLRRQALAMLHARGLEIARLQDQHRRLLAEYRRLRETILSDERRSVA